MKTNLKSVRLLFITALLGVFASFAYAGPGIQHWETQNREAQFRALKAGEKVAYICNVCKTTSEVPIMSQAQAMALCKEGDTIVCPSCQKTSKVVMKRNRNDPVSFTEVTYVNEKGEECAFIAKLAGSLETIRSEAPFSLLKVGEKVAYVCSACKTVSEIAIESHEHAVGLCKEGESVTCPSCKRTAKIVASKNVTRNEPRFSSQIIYVNEKGEECAFIAKVVEKT